MTDDMIFRDETITLIVLNVCSFSAVAPGTDKSTEAMWKEDIAAPWDGRVGELRVKEMADVEADRRSRTRRRTLALCQLLTESTIS